LELFADVKALLESLMQEIAIDKDFEGWLELVDDTVEINEFPVFLPSFDPHY